VRKKIDLRENKAERKGNEENIYESL